MERCATVLIMVAEDLTYLAHTNLSIQPSPLIRKPCHLPLGLMLGFCEVLPNHSHRLGDATLVGLEGLNLKWGDNNHSH